MSFQPNFSVVHRENACFAQEDPSQSGWALSLLLPELERQSTEAGTVCKWDVEVHAVEGDEEEEEGEGSEQHPFVVVVRKRARYPRRRSAPVDTDNIVTVKQHFH